MPLFILLLRPGVCLQSDHCVSQNCDKMKKVHKKANSNKELEGPSYKDTVFRYASWRKTIMSEYNTDLADNE